MCQQNHKAIDDKHKDESMHEQNADSGDNQIYWQHCGYITWVYVHIYYGEQYNRISNIADT